MSMMNTNVLKMWNQIPIETRQQLIRFILVGMMNAAFGYSVFSLLIYSGFHYTVASFFSICLGVLFSFNTTGRIVFQNFYLGLLLKYITVYFFLYCLNIGILDFLHLFSSNFYLIGFIAIFPHAIFCFFINWNDD